MATKKVTRGTKKAPRTAPRFADLAESDRRRIAGTIAGTFKKLGFFCRGGYNVVHGDDEHNRKRVNAETGGEDMQLTLSERNRLVALARQTARNSHHLEGMLHQLEINVVGTEGGKAIFNFPPEYDEAADVIREAFADWASEAEYFDDLSLQEVLRKILRTQIIGGDLVLVFDWDLTAANSGQIIAFEPDCIGNLESDEFKRRFPKFTQRQGIIKNEDGKTVGVIVSWSQRGQSAYQPFDADGRLAAWPLIRPDGMRWRDTPFLIFRGMSRFNQIRGNSRLWAGLATITDQNDMQGFEVQSAKRGAQMIGQVTQQAEENAAELGADLDPDATSPVTTDDALAAAEAASAAAEDEQISLDMEAIEGAGAIYDVMPPGVKFDLYDTKHPNDKLVEFSKWLVSGVGYGLGLGRIHASGESIASYSAAQAEMLMSSIEFQDEFHRLKTGFLDWAFRIWSLRAQALGIIPQDTALPPHWRRQCVKWQKPPKRAINPVDEQNALNSGLKNGTILYRDKLGPDWRKKLGEWAEEVEFCRANNIPHPCLTTVSGQQIETTGQTAEQQES